LPSSSLLFLSHSSLFAFPSPCLYFVCKQVFSCHSLLALVVPGSKFFFCSSCYLRQRTNERNVFFSSSERQR
jgi:hypothetical protein